MKMSKAAKAAAYDALSHERDLYALLVHFYENNIVQDATEVVVDGDSVYLFHLYQVMRGNGGTLVRVHRCDGQAANVDVSTFDDWLTATGKMQHDGRVFTDVKIAADKLRLARQRIYDAEKARGNDSNGNQAMNTGEPRGGG